MSSADSQQLSPQGWPQMQRAAWPTFTSFAGHLHLVTEQSAGIKTQPCQQDVGCFHKLLLTSDLPTGSAKAFPDLNCISTSSVRNSASAPFPSHVLIPNKHLIQ